MYVYSLIACTSSEIRAVLLSISFSRFAISTEAAIRTSAARAVSASRVANNDSSASGLTPSSRQIGRQLPQVVLPVTAQQGIDLIFQIADGQRIERGFVRLDERSFQLLDFRSLRRREVAPSQLLGRVLDSLQHVAQQAGRAFRGRGGIVQFVRQPSRKLSQARPAGRAAAPSAWSRESGLTSGPPAAGPAPAFSAPAQEILPRGICRMRPSVTARPVITDTFMRENGSNPVTSPGSSGIVTASPPNAPRICCWPSRTTTIATAGAPCCRKVSPALSGISSAWLMNQSNLIVGQTFKCGDAQQIPIFRSFTPTPCSNTDG